MQTQAAAATLSLTIELQRAGAQLNVGPADLDATRGRLFSALRTHSLSATWALADPAASASARALINSMPRQEVALLVERGARTGISSESLQRLQRAREQGVPVKSVVMLEGEMLSDPDIWLPEGVTAIRPPARPVMPKAKRAQAAATGGIYIAPAAWRVEKVSNWWRQWNLLLRVNRHLRAGELHVTLSVGQLVEASRRTWNLVDRLLLLAGQQQQRGRLRVVTLGQLADEHTSQQQFQSQRSILRAA
jgi:hypothetical protein